MSLEDEIKELKISRHKMLLHFNAQKAYITNLENATKHLQARIDEQAETIRIAIKQITDFEG